MIRGRDCFFVFTCPMRKEENMNAKNVVMTALLLSLGLAISAQAQAPIPGEANLLVWLKADDGVQNSGNTGACAVGSETGDWLDKSGNGTDASYIQGTMTLETANFGDPAADHNVVRFYRDGYYQFMGPDPNALLVPVMSVFVVIQTGMPAPPDPLYRNMYFSTYNNVAPGESGLTCDLYNNGYLQSFTGGSGPCNYDMLCPKKAPEVPEYHIICTRIDLPFNHKAIDLDGETMGESYGMGCISWTPGTIACLGSLKGVAYYPELDIAEMVIYNDASLQTRDRIESYLSEKYGIPLTAKVCGDQGYNAADLDKNCVVDLQDFATMATTWLQCTDPAIPGCGYVELGEL